MHFLFIEQRLLVLSLLRYKYTSEYLLCGRLRVERTGVESLNLLTVWARARTGVPKAGPDYGKGIVGKCLGRIRRRRA